MKILTLVVALALAPALAQAQTLTYKLKLVLDGVTYEGTFKWTPDMVMGVEGEMDAGPGTYTGCSQFQIPPAS